MQNISQTCYAFLNDLQMIILYFKNLIYDSDSVFSVIVKIRFSQVKVSASS